MGCASHHCWIKLSLTATYYCVDFQVQRDREAVACVAQGKGCGNKGFRIACVRKLIVGSQCLGEVAWMACVEVG